jgi:3-oxoacyl-[acyl-carrier protein] reductase
VAAYSATKGGIDGMTRSLARELGSRGITVNSVAPGYMETDLTHDMNPKQLQQIVRRTPLKRPGTVEDVAGVIAFLLSSDAAFISGQTIVVDGGLTC